MTEEKLILDACCGSRMFWFDKEHPNAVFADIRDEAHILCDGRTLVIRPDIQMDFTNMPFEDESFHMVSFDPPHMTSLGANSWMALKYGRLTETWKEQIRKGFRECFRVLKTNGVLIFKWNEHDVKLAEVLALCDYKPIIGHTSGRHGKTIWLCFMKI